MASPTFRQLPALAKTWGIVGKFESKTSYTCTKRGHLDGKQQVAATPTASSSYCDCYCLTYIQFYSCTYEDTYVGWVSIFSNQDFFS